MPLIRFPNGTETRTNDLRGMDLVGCAYSLYPGLEGSLRDASDPPISGYFVEDGILVRSCARCGNVAPLPDSECTSRFCAACHERRHSECGACGQCTTRRCPECDNCSGCCECPHCDGCGSLGVCGEHDSDMCSSCCPRCNNEGDTREVDQIHPAGKRDRFACTRLVGVEWEHNNFDDRIFRWAERWGGGIHEDGSCGWEAVTPPIAGDNIRKCLADLGSSGVDGNVDDTCGMHVHVDASDFRWADMYRMIALYQKIEPVLYVLAGQDRSCNDYCDPCGQRYRDALTSPDRKGGVLGVALSPDGRLSDGRVDARYAEKKSGGRYKGMNLCPWISGRRKKRKDLTIEFRMHERTDDAERVIQWAELLALVVDWTHRASDRDVEELPKSALRALCAIAPTKAAWILDRVRDWKRHTRVLKVARRAGMERRRITVRDGAFAFAS